MKKRKLIRYFAVAAIATAVSINSCKREATTVTMTAWSDKVEIGFKAGADVTINWGDGTPPETFTVYLGQLYDRSWPDYANRTITVTSSGLIELLCANSGLTDLDFGNKPNLTTLVCAGNQLTNLDVSKNLLLNKFYCQNNMLTNLDLSKTMFLEEVDCSENQLTNLNLNVHKRLTSLICSGNRLSSLDLSQNPALTLLNCSDNNLTTSALNDLFASLPNNAGNIFIDGNPGTKNCDQSIATAKGWKVFPDNRPKLVINDIEYTIHDIVVVNDKKEMEIKAITRLPGFETTLPKAPKGQYAFCKEFPIWCVCAGIEEGGGQYHCYEMEFQFTANPGEIAVVYRFSNNVPKIEWIVFFETKNTFNQLFIDWANLNRTE